jgi:peptide/nickel transport system permease protein
MLSYIIRRIAIAGVLIVVVGILSQLAIHLIPGDPAYLILGAEMAPDPETLASVRHKLGLDRPLYQQVADGVYGLFRLDFGTSLQDRRPISKLIANTFPVSLALVVSATIFATVFGLILGAIAAIKHNSLVDWLVTVTATFGISTPVFITGTFLIYIFCIHWKLVPASGFTPLFEDPSAFFLRLLLPTITVGVANGAAITRMTRSCMLETLRADYMTTARAKGLKESLVLTKHGLRNALIPVVAMIGVQFGSMFGRTVLIEAVFNWPGMMSTLVVAARYHDFPVVRGILVVIAAIFILINLVTDMTYAWIDPRIAYD